MCQVNVPQEVTDVVSEFVKQGKVFTAYDVTVAARGKTKQNVRHNDVRQYVTHFMNFEPEAQGYGAASVNLNIPGKNNPVAIVFFPQGQDPYSHPLAVQVGSDPQDDGTPDDGTQTDGSAPASTVQGDPNAPFDNEVVKITAEGRLNIPKSVLEQLSAVNQVGGSVDVIFDGSVYPKKPNDDGRIRLGNQLVSKVGKTEFKVSVDTSKNCVVVEPV